MQGRTRWFTAGAVAAGLLAGSLVASAVSAQMAPSPGSGAAGCILGQGATQESIDQALAAHTARMEALVTSGALTQEQADAMTAWMTSRLESGNRGGFGMMGPGMMGGPGMLGGHMQRFGYPPQP
jgi:hypothetical protein